MSIYNQDNVNHKSPYFYIIEHITSTSSKRFYAGYKSKEPNSETLLLENGYKSSSKTILDIIEKEGLQAFVIRKIRHFDTAEEAVEYETRFLKRLKIPNKTFYNKHANHNHFGLANYKHSEETKHKITQSNLGQKRSDETKAKMREKALNRSPETKLKLSIAAKKRFKRPDQRRFLSMINLGRKQSETEKLKRSLSLRKLYQNPENKLNLIAGGYKSWITRRANQAAKNSVLAKPSEHPVALSNGTCVFSNELLQS